MPSWFKRQARVATTSQSLLGALLLNAESSQMKPVTACTHLSTVLPILRSDHTARLACIMLSEAHAACNFPEIPALGTQQGFGFLFYEVQF